MAQGLRIWDQNGNLILNTDDRLPHTLGKLYVTNSGEKYVPEFSQGIPWIYTLVDWANMFEENQYKEFNSENYAKATLDGYTIRWRWTREDRRRYNYATWIIYGVY